MPDVTRIIEQTATESIYNDDWAMIDRPTEGEDGGTRKILVSRLKELLCGDYIADEWVAGETYANGAIVSHEGKLYYNNSGGALVQTIFNSNAWLEVKIDELLEKVIGSIGEKWRLVDTYHYDDLVVYGGRLYRCIKNTSTQGTWVSNEWEPVSIYEIIQNLPKSASDVTYDNTDSGLEADNVQDAIEELGNKTIHIDDDGKFYVYVNNEE